MKIKILFIIEIWKFIISITNLKALHYAKFQTGKHLNMWFTTRLRLNINQLLSFKHVFFNRYGYNKIYNN
jgi:hypothetical protein